MLIIVEHNRTDGCLLKLPAFVLILVRAGNFYLFFIKQHNNRVTTRQSALNRGYFILIYDKNDKNTYNALGKENMQGLMMNTQLTITSLMRHAQQLSSNAEIVSITKDNPLHRYTYGEAFERCARLANAMQKLGLQQGEIIGTLAWNDYRHFEIYYGIGCAGSVCHTINPRLFVEQLVYIINHAEDQWLFIDPDFVPLLQKLQDKLPKVKGYIVLTDQDHMPENNLANVYCYETLIANESSHYYWPELDENTALNLCYTSGTTGNPKGVMYSHRALVIQTYAACLPNVNNLTKQDVILPIVPMFHVNAWNIPYSAALVGCKMVFPGNKMGDGETLQRLIETEQVTVSAGVPTVLLNLLNYLRESGKRIDCLQAMAVGGAACPLSLMEEMDNYGVNVKVGWGMTETSPLGTTNDLPKPREAYTDEEFAQLRVKAGMPVFGVEVKIVDDENNELPRDGVAFGSLKVRGPWIARQYFKIEDNDAWDENGWFDTGDVATIDENCCVTITDRTKDVIKSGGEWISSIDLENTAIGHPDVLEAAVIGVAHPKWTERPLLVVVKSPNSTVSKQQILDYMSDKVAKWWQPDDVVFVDELPHTATGKVQKLQLRKDFADYKFPEN